MVDVVVFPTFAIAEYAEAILQNIMSHVVTGVDLPTSSGKSLYLPYFLAKKGFKVRVALPTTVAVRNSFEFHKKFSSELKVGFAAAREVHYTDADQLIYFTYGHIVSKILGMIKNKQDPRSVFGDIFFVDEVHTGSTQITVLLGLLKYMFFDTENSEKNTIHIVVKKNLIVPPPRLVFSTATFNSGDIVTYFGTDLNIFKVEGKTKFIQDIYMTKSRNVLKHDPMPEIEIIVKFEYGMWLTSDLKYHGVIFRSGQLEVEETVRILSNKFTGYKIIFIGVFSGLSQEEILKIFDTTDGFMKVIVGTNIIESSVTIQDVGFVIDDMLEKLPGISSTGGDSLKLSLISKATSMQRRGRTGRTISGRAYRLITINEYSLLDPYRSREIDRVPIYDIVLQLLDAGLDPIEILQISQGRYIQARNLLLKLFMIILVEPVQPQTESYVSTPIGKFITSLSLGIYSSYMIYLALQRYAITTQVSSTITTEEYEAENIAFITVMAVACMIEVYGPSFFFSPRKLPMESVREHDNLVRENTEKYHEKFRGKTDMHTFVNIYWNLRIFIEFAGIEQVHQWSRLNSMNNKKILEMLIALKQIEQTIEHMLSSVIIFKNIVPSKVRSIISQNLSQHNDIAWVKAADNIMKKYKFDKVSDYVVTLFTQVFQENKLKLRKDKKGKVHYISLGEKPKYFMIGKDSFSKISMAPSKAPKFIIPASTIEVIGQGGKIVNIAAIFVPSNE